MKEIIKARKKLYEQLGQLAEQSSKALPEMETEYAKQMTEIYRELVKPFRIFVFSSIFGYLCLCFHVQLVKFFRSK